ncbi:MAG: glutamine synthetase family protein [Acidobacteriota bacterium]|nr:glutamine synthetase family protein [Acidobacteriota bacterium]
MVLETKTSPPFALSRPLTVLLNKPAADFLRSDFLRVIREKGLERITFHYTALDGKLKELKIPLADAAQADSVLAEGERVDGSSLFKGMVDESLSDLYVVPDFRTAFLNPFDDKSLDFICRYLTRDGQPASFTPDNVLARAEAHFRERTGLELRAMGELEFFLMCDKTETIYPGQKQQGYHGSLPFVKSGPILSEMITLITQITGAVKYAHSEVGFIDSVRSDLEEIKGRRAEQLEIELLPRPVVEMADHIVMARWIIRNVAFRHGSLATFTPKVEEGMAGNGFHFHMELHKDGHSVMTEPDGRLSEPARRLIGGLCEYADSLTAFGNTVSSAYLRLIPNQEAPTRVCWSDLNRSAMIRVPLGWTNLSHLGRRVNPGDTESYMAEGSRQTVELRSPDGSAITHLLLAGIVMAADWAFNDSRTLFGDGGPLELAERLYIKGNIHADPELLKRLPKLPASCVESARLLLAKRDLYERDGIFPPPVIDYVIRLLEKEKDEDMSVRLANLPADDRLHETRRIMHKDLHRH